MGYLIVPINLEIFTIGIISMKYLATKIVNHDQTLLRLSKVDCRDYNERKWHFCHFDNNEEKYPIPLCTAALPPAWPMLGQAKTTIIWWRATAAAPVFYFTKSR